MPLSSLEELNPRHVVLYFSLGLGCSFPIPFAVLRSLTLTHYGFFRWFKKVEQLYNIAEECRTQFPWLQIDYDNFRRLNLSFHGLHWSIYCAVGNMPHFCIDYADPSGETVNDRFYLKCSQVREMLLEPLAIFLPMLQRIASCERANQSTTFFLDDNYGFPLSTFRTISVVVQKNDVQSLFRLMTRYYGPLNDKLFRGKPKDCLLAIGGATDCPNQQPYVPIAEEEFFQCLELEN